MVCLSACFGDGVSVRNFAGAVAEGHGVSDSPVPLFPGAWEKYPEKSVL